MAARLDWDVYAWLKRYGEGYLTRINTIFARGDVQSAMGNSMQNGGPERTRISDLYRVKVAL